jgi:hypothetical protein
MYHDHEASAIQEWRPNGGYLQGWEPVKIPLRRPANF